MLKERVKKVLSLKPGRRPFGTRGLVRVLAICLACVVPILALTAQTKPAKDPLPGTWVNEEYGTSKGMSQRFVIFPDGRELHYMMMTDKEPWYEYKSVIEAKWRDAEGNFWYKSRFMGWYYGFPAPSEETCGDKGYALVWINASGTTMEAVQAGARYPDEEDWSLMPHGIYYKQP